MNTTQLMRATMVAVLSLGAMLAPGAARAQGTAVIAPNDLAYTDVDRLAELGYLDSLIMGQRPYSRREFGRIVRTARVRFERDAATRGRLLVDQDAARFAGIILQRLEQRFGDDADERRSRFPLVSLLDGAALSLSTTDAERRGFPAPQSRSVEATIDPLALPRLAQPAIAGRTIDLELSQRIEPTSWLALTARERIEYRAPRDTATYRARGELLYAGARARLRNVALSVGRLPVGWAQSEGDGLFFASDAPAVDQISIANDLPFTMPGFLGRLGPTRGTLVIADLGPSSARNNSKLLAYKVSVQPASWFEAGGTFMNHYGGEGGRKSSFGNQLIDFLPFIDIFRKHNYTDSSRTLDVDSDKMLGVDARVRTGLLGGMTIAGELLIDDFDINILPRLLTGYGSQTVRLIFPSIRSPALSARLGAKHMGTITYTHPVLAGGFASRQRLLGDELGPDAKEFSADLRWSPAAAGAFTLELREQVYSNATYGGEYTDASLVQTRYYKVSRTADERRHLVIVGVLVRPDADFSMQLRGGLQFVENYAFSGERRNNYVANFTFRLRQ